jgi:DNA-binding response OmpR family regulator
MANRVLVIEDDSATASLIALSLRARGFEVTSVDGGRAGLKVLYDLRPDLILLDIMMEEMDGWQVCQRIREVSDVPIIIISALSSEVDVVRGLRLGADDYLRKPFSLMELSERVFVVLRRGNKPQTSDGVFYDDGVLRVDQGKSQVWRHGQVLNLTPTEFRLLTSLIARKGSVVRHEDLLEQVWGPAYRGDNACLSLYIRYLREKIEDDPAEPRYLQTRWGLGYWFAGTDVPRSNS